MATVLLVEDNELNQEVATELLRGAGLVVDVADNGKSGVEKVLSASYDIVLMDVVMPGQSGYQATRELARDPQTCEIPVVICSSKGNESDRVWGMRQGAVDYIVKPVSADILVAKAQLALAG